MPKREEKCCYHCSSLNHFIHDCPLVNASRTDSHLNHWGDGSEEGSWGPSDESDHANDTPRGSAQGIKQCTDSLLESWSLPVMAGGWECSPRWGSMERAVWPSLIMACKYITITPSYVRSCTLKVGLISDLVGGQVACVGLGNTYTRPLGYMIIQVQVEVVWGYDEDQIALVVCQILQHRFLSS